MKDDKGQISDKKIACRARPRITPKPKFLVTAEAYLFATFDPSILDFFGLCLHWASLVHVFNYAILGGIQMPILKVLEVVKLRL